jgi:hypothetical protein
VQNEEVDKGDGYGNEKQNEHDGARTGFMVRMTTSIDVDARTCGNRWSVVGDCRYRQMPCCRQT